MDILLLQRVSEWVSESFKVCLTSDEMNIIENLMALFHVYFLFLKFALFYGTDDFNMHMNDVLWEFTNYNKQQRRENLILFRKVTLKQMTVKSFSTFTHLSKFNSFTYYFCRNLDEWILMKIKGKTTWTLSRVQFHFYSQVFICEVTKTRCHMKLKVRDVHQTHTQHFFK